MPKPHVTLQALHSDHADHSPSTAIQYGVLHFDNFLLPIICMTREQMRNHDSLPGFGAQSRLATKLPMVVQCSPCLQSESVRQKFGPGLGFGLVFGSTIR